MKIKTLLSKISVYFITLAIFLSVMLALSNVSYATESYYNNIRTLVFDIINKRVTSVVTTTSLQAYGEEVQTSENTVNSEENSSLNESGSLSEDSSLEEGISLNDETIEISLLKDTYA